MAMDAVVVVVDVSALGQRVIASFGEKRQHSMTRGRPLKGQVPPTNAQGSLQTRGKLLVCIRCSPSASARYQPRELGRMNWWLRSKLRCDARSKP